MSQLADLARPFPDVLIHENPAGGGSYVKHATVVQRLLAAVGPFSFEIRDVIRGDVRAIPPNPDANSRRGKEGSPALTNAIVGAICSLSVTVDGHEELFGRPTSLPWGLEIDVHHRPAGYLDEPTFHPTFLYESLWCLLLFATIVAVERRFRLRRGQPMAMYVAMYTFGRFFFENMRVDPASKMLGMRFNALLSAALCIGATVWFVVLGRRAPSEPEPAELTEPAEGTGGG